MSRRFVQVEGATPSKSVTRTESRNTSVIGEVIFGSILFFAGFPCLWFNEKGYALTKTFLRKYLKACTPVLSDQIDQANDTKLICVTSETTTEDNITDDLFADVTVQHSVKLTRKCEMLQWVEHRSSTRISVDNDRVMYTYNTQWKDSFVNSQVFVENYSHENIRTDWMFDGTTILANKVSYGAFNMSELQKGMCKKSEPVAIPFASA